MLSRIAVRAPQAAKPRAGRIAPLRLCNAPVSSLVNSRLTHRITAFGSPAAVPSVQLNYSQSRIQKRFFSEENVVIKVPSMGDSITDGAVGEIKKNVGEAVEADEVVLVVETTKINHEIRAPKAGVITEILVKVGDTVLVDQPVFKIAAGATATAAPAAAPKAEAKATEAPKAPQTATQTAPQAPPTQAPAASKAAPPPPPPKPLQPVAPKTAGDRSERREPMSRMRQTIAKNMKDSQNTLAMLTTFQEADMFELSQLRAQLKDDFEAKHGVKLGFMSCFVKAAAAALKESPAVNALIDGKEIVYRNYVDISVAVATPKGLVVPVLKNVDQMSFADIEKQIAYLGQKARNGAITLEDITGGTFTISNGGVYGSLMGTPIINPGQSAILGMHGIFEKPVVVNKQIVIRPMMYLALTYDHRLIDGRDAVTFLKKIKLSVEDPRRLLLD